jgi:DNA-binding SARP family transcriptional activator/tetratricopeptide (TPR) repeat protein
VNLHLQVLGPVRVRLGDEVRELASRRSAATVVALAVKPVWSRRELADLLWPDKPHKTARTNLRGVLHGLREALPGRVTGTRSEVRWETVDGDVVDLHALRDALDAGRPPSTVATLAEGLAVDSDAFDAWLEAVRGHLDAARVRALTLLAGHATERRDHATAEALLRRALSLEPRSEALYRELIAVLLASGRRAAVDALSREVRAAWDGEPPTRLTSALREVLVRVPTPTPGRLPSVGDRFLGRHAERGTLADLLRANRLVSVVGVGGAGKTRLALEVCGSWDGPRPADGLWFVDLDAARPGDVASHVAQRLSLLLDPRVGALEALSAALERRRVLVVLDNAESHEDETADLVVALLRDCPEVRLLVTSRRPLRLRAERLLRLTEPLEDPGALFVERSGASPADPLLAPLMARVGGLPLAVELAAASWRRLGSTQALLAHLETAALISMESDERDRPARHGSLEDAIEGTWALLDDASRDILRTLSAFVGSVSTGQLDALDVHHGAAGLAACGLIPKRDHRVRLHPAVREFAWARVGDPHVREQQHLACVRRALDAAVVQLRSHEHHRGMDALRHLRADLFVAWDRAVARRDLDALDAMASPFKMACEVLGWYREAEARSRAARELEDRDVFGFMHAWALSRVGQLEEASQVLGERRARTLDQATALAVVSVATNALDRVFEAAQLGDTELADERGALERARRASLHNSKALAHLRRGQVREARDAFLRSRAHAGADWPGLEAMALHGEASIARFEGDVEGAIALHREALRLRERFGEVRGTALTLSSLAACHAQLGEFAEARRALLRSRRLAEDQGSLVGRALAEHNLGCLEIEDDDAEEALGRFEAAIAIRRRSADHVGLAYSLGSRSLAWAMCDRRDRWEADLAEALVGVRGAGDLRLARNVASYAKRGAERLGVPADDPMLAALIRAAAGP